VFLKISIITTLLTSNRNLVFLKISIITTLLTSNRNYSLYLVQFKFSFVSKLAHFITDNIEIYIYIFICFSRFCIFLGWNGSFLPVMRWNWLGFTTLCHLHRTTYRSPNRGFVFRLQWIYEQLYQQANSRRKKEPFPSPDEHFIATILMYKKIWSSIRRIVV
jgi:hypothetical protein